MACRGGFWLPGPGRASGFAARPPPVIRFARPSMSQSSHFRAHGRHDVDLSAALALPGDSEKGGAARVVNLSLAGACVEIGEPVTPGTWLTVEIMAPSLWDPLILRARVVWARGDRGGA